MQANKGRERSVKELTENTKCETHETASLVYSSVTAGS